MKSRQKAKTGAFRQLAWLPIPFFLVAMAVLWAIRLKVEWDSPTLVMVLNFLTRTLACMLIVYLAGKSFLVSGAPGLLLLGCGVAIWGATGFVASSSLNMEANFGVTVSNMSIWLAALCHLSGVILSTRSKLTIRPAVFWLGAGYVLALGTVGLVTLVTLKGWLPVFFVDSQGGTLVRYLVLGSALIMFTLTAVLLREANHPSLSSFTYWYTLALLLIAVGVFGMMVQLSRASLLNWVCRASQYLSGIYMFIAAIASMRESGVRDISLAQAIKEPRYRYGVAIAVVIAATALRWAFLPTMGGRSVFLTFYPAVMAAALYGGLWTGLMATILSALAIIYFFLEPIGQFIVIQPVDWLALMIFLLSCVIISFIIEAMHRARASLVSYQAHLAELVSARTMELEREIIERKQAEATLRRQADILDLSYEAIFAWELDGVIISWNQGAQRLYGYSSEEAIGQAGHDLLKTIHLQTFDGIKSILVQDKTWTGELEQITKDGRTIIVESRFQLVQDELGQQIILETNRDITERKQTEEALRVSDERFRRYFELGLIGMVISSLNKGFIEVNDKMCEILGYERSELLQMTWVELTYPEDLDTDLANFDRVLAGEIDGYSIDKRFIRKDGQIIYATISVKCIRCVSGQAEYFVALLQDITKRKQDEEGLRKADQQKDQFIAVLSHELRNPLAAIRNSLSILDRATPEGAQAKRAKDVINRQAGQLSRLVDDLLDITRINQNKINLQRQQLKLNELVRRSVEDHRSLFEKNGVSLEMGLSSDVILVNGDETRLTQVIGNLLLNAAKFTSRGESTRVSIERNPSRQQAIISVVDTGVGIRPEMIPSLFQPFMQADTSLNRSRSGLGLGLALSKGLVELHGGDISAKSAGLGKGSEFIVCLPIDDTKAEEPQASPEEVPHCNRRVLIIDDNLDLARSLYELLELCEHEVAVAYDGFEGLEKAREFIPEVVLCDIGLPGMDGYEVARAFRADKALKDVFMVALTGYAQSADQIKATKAGFKRHLAKPVDLEELERLLAEIPVKVSE